MTEIVDSWWAPVQGACIIVAIVAAFSIAVYIGTTKDQPPPDTKFDQAVRELEVWERAAGLYYKIHGRYPKDIATLAQCGDAHPVGPYLDPWGRAYVCEGDRENFVLWSWGPDGRRCRQNSVAIQYGRMRVLRDDEGRHITHLMGEEICP